MLISFSVLAQNYRVLLAGAKGGLKTGTRVGLWTLAYVGIEYGVSRLQQDMTNQRGADVAMQRTRLIAGGVAGLGIASGASLICEFCREEIKSPRISIVSNFLFFLITRSAPRPYRQKSSTCWSRHRELCWSSSRCSAVHLSKGDDTANMNFPISFDEYSPSIPLLCTNTF